MASTIGAWSYVKNDGSLSTKDDVNSNLSSTGKNKSTTNKTTLDVEQFLQLMVAEMQNQDPLEPTDNSDYMAQLATFTQVEATKEMNDNTLQDMASNLVGKQVIMTTTQNSNGYIGGTVDYWETINGTVYLGIGGKLYDIADLDTVMDKDYFDKVITSTEGEKIKNKNELKLQIISEFDEAEECVKEAAYLQQKAAQFQQRALNIQKRALLRNLTYD